jgi:hypothetical protein
MLVNEQEPECYFRHEQYEFENELIKISSFSQDENIFFHAEIAF